MSLAQETTLTRPRIEPGSPDLESDALTTRPVRPRHLSLTMPVDITIESRIHIFIGVSS